MVELIKRIASLLNRRWYRWNHTLPSATVVGEQHHFTRADGSKFYVGGRH